MPSDLIGRLVKSVPETSEKPSYARTQTGRWVSDLPPRVARLLLTTHEWRVTPIVSRCLWSLLQGPWPNARGSPWEPPLLVQERQRLLNPPREVVLAPWLEQAPQKLRRLPQQKVELCKLSFVGPVERAHASIVRQKPVEIGEIP